ncbi:MAG: hypothetical protein CMD25_02980 [Flavobacteriales bacterium]|nr:hypothetical protein [Flavobacteriales bacterium]
MKREVKVGIVSIVVIFILILGINYLKGTNIFKNNITFYALYQNIDGLQIGAPVTVSGFKVGSVTDIDMLTESNNNLLVTINIEKELVVPKESILKIVNQDLMGTKGVNLIFSSSSDNASSGDTLRSSLESSLQEEVNAQILPFKRKAEELIVSIDSVMMIVTAVLNKDARKDLSKSIESLGETFSLMSSSMKKVDGIIDANEEKISNIIFNMESILSNIEESNSSVNSILSNMSLISDSLSNSNLTSLVNNFNTLMTQINSKEGSAGLLFNDDKLYTNLEKTTKELSELIKDIKDNPKRYINFSLIKRSNNN